MDIMHSIFTTFWNNIIYHYPLSGKEGHTFLTLHCDNSSAVWTKNHKQQQKWWNAPIFNQANHTSSITFTHSWEEMVMLSILKKVTYRLQHSDIQDWISELLQMPTFHLTLQVMWWFGEEEKKGKKWHFTFNSPTFNCRLWYWGCWFWVLLPEANGTIHNQQAVNDIPIMLWISTIQRN